MGGRTASAAYPPSNASNEASAGTKILLSDRDTATLLGCSKSTVWRWAAEGVIVKPLRIGGISRWKLADLEAVIARAEAERGAIAA